MTSIVSSLIAATAVVAVSGGANGAPAAEFQIKIHVQTPSAATVNKCLLETFPEVLEKVVEIADRYSLTLSNVFHAGDGNLHPNISFDRRDKEQLARVMAAGAEILETCVAAGGVITGEHGVGVEKRDFLHLVFREADLDAMRRLRAAFDPDLVCNPGKEFPTTRFCAESDPKARGYDRVPLA